MTQTNLDRLKVYADAHAQLLTDNCSIEPELYQTYGVKRGLRDQKGRGVLAGLTNISEIESNKQVNGETVPCEGRLFYRGYDIIDLVGAESREHRFGFEEIAYLLLFGDLPTREELDGFQRTLADCRTLPTNFVRDVIMKAPSRDMMNSLSRSVLTLASYDDNVSDVSLANVLRQCLMLIAVFPLLAVYGYHSYNHYERDESLYIHRPDDSLSAAENLLRMLRPDKSYTDLEARVLDLALILHMEHGGGNNSTFTTHVVTSSGSDTYSVVAAALASLKGPKHGGANIKVVEMMADLKKTLQNPHDEGQVGWPTIFTGCSTARPLTARASSTAWATPSTASATPAPPSSAASWSGWPRRRTRRRSSPSTPWSNAWRPRSSRASARSTRASAPTWTSTAA